MSRECGELKLNYLPRKGKGKMSAEDMGYFYGSQSTIFKNRLDFRHKFNLFRELTSNINSGARS